MILRAFDTEGRIFAVFGAFKVDQEQKFLFRDGRHLAFFKNNHTASNNHKKNMPLSDMRLGKQTTADEDGVALSAMLR